MTFYLHPKLNTFVGSSILKTFKYSHRCWYFKLKDKLENSVLRIKNKTGKNKSVLISNLYRIEEWPKYHAWFIKSTPNVSYLRHRPCFHARHRYNTGPGNNTVLHIYFLFYVARNNNIFMYTTENIDACLMWTKTTEIHSLITQLFCLPPRPENSVYMHSLILLR